MNDATTVSRPAWLGIDVAKRTFDAAVHPPWEPGLQVRFADLPKRSFERTPEGAAQLAGWLDETLPQGEVRTLMEATGQYSLELAALRDMSRQRTFIVNTIVAARNRLEEIAASREVAALHRKTIRRLEDDLLQIESLMRQHVESSHLPSPISHLPSEH